MNFVNMTAAIALLAGSGTTLHATPITLTPTDGGTTLDNSDNNAAIGSNVRTAVLDAGVSRAGIGEHLRSVVIFTLPTLEAGQTLDSATFRIYLADFDDLDGPPDGPASLLHLPEVNTSAVVAADFHTTPADAVTASLVTPASTIGQYYEVSVTSFVQADYDNDPSGSQVATFRIQVDNAAFADASRHYIFNPGDPNPPQLVLNVVPEPGSLGLLGLGAALMFLRRRGD